MAGCGYFFCVAARLWQQPQRATQAACETVPSLEPRLVDPTAFYDPDPSDNFGSMRRNSVSTSLDCLVGHAVDIIVRPLNSAAILPIQFHAMVLHSYFTTFPPSIWSLDDYLARYIPFDSNPDAYLDSWKKSFKTIISDPKHATMREFAAVLLERYDNNREVISSASHHPGVGTD